MHFFLDYREHADDVMKCQGNAKSLSDSRLPYIPAP